MANPSVTNTFVNGNVADASQVNQNFTDIINGLTDGSKSLNVDAVTAAGTATLNGNVILGNAASDNLTINAAIVSDVTIKSTDAGAAAGPNLIIDRDSASAADSDAIGKIIFRGNDDAGTPADNDYASIEASIVDSGAGSEDGKLDIKITEAATATSYITAEATKGVKIKGAVDGVAPTDATYVGYIGEIKQVALADQDGGSSGTWTNIASLSLDKGKYLLSGQIMVSKSSTVISILNGVISRFSGTNTSDHVEGDNRINTGAAGDAGQNVSVIISNYLMTITSDDTDVFLKAAATFSGGGNFRFWCRLTAIRIA